MSTEELDPLRDNLVPATELAGQFGVLHDPDIAKIEEWLDCEECPQQFEDFSYMDEEGRVHTITVWVHDIDRGETETGHTVTVFGRMVVTNQEVLLVFDIDEADPDTPPQSTLTIRLPEETTN